MDSIDYILAGGYLLIWVLTMIWYQRKLHRIDGGSIIILSYITYAVFSLLSLSAPVEPYYKPLQLLPYIYLYIMLMIALSPTIALHRQCPKVLTDAHSRIIPLIGITTIVAGLMQVPDLFSDTGTGLIRLVTDSEAGKDAYEETVNSTNESGNSINNLASIIFNALYDISIFIFFYLLSRPKKNWIILIGLSITMLVGIIQPLLNGLRGPVILGLSTIIMAYFLFKQFFSNTVRKVGKYIGIFFITLTLIPIATITFSRFGQEEQGGSEDNILNHLYWYVGQGSLYFNNYGLDDGGIRYGDRTFNFAKRLIDSNASHNYVERRATFKELDINDELFVTFVGDFTIDFGPIIALVIFIVFNAFVILQTRTKNKEIRPCQLLLLYFSMCICMQGGMSLFSYSDTSNLKIIAFMALYSYLAYHDILIEKFPVGKMTTK